MSKSIPVVGEVRTGAISSKHRIFDSWKPAVVYAGLHAQLNSGPPHVPGESGNADYYYNFTNPFSVMGCDNATGFSKLQTITVYGSPITKLTLGFDNGTVLTVGNCSESCTQSTFSFGTSEV